jgi:hypothetical protein
MKTLEKTSETASTNPRAVLVRAQSPEGIVPAQAVAEHYAASTDETKQNLLRIATAQLRRNLVRSVRTGSINDLSDQGEALTALLRTPLPEDLSIRWSELSHVLTEAAQLREPSAAIAIARGNRGRNMEILVAVQKAGDRIARKKLKQSLPQSNNEFSDSHLSHALAQLEQGDLIRREKSGNEVMVLITPLGIESVRIGSDQDGLPAARTPLQRPNAQVSMLTQLTESA